jgi:hypothetical protein
MPLPLRRRTPARRRDPFAGLAGIEDLFARMNQALAQDEGGTGVGAVGTDPGSPASERGRVS